jgi:hypothetical protein
LYLFFFALACCLFFLTSPPERFSIKYTREQWFMQIIWDLICIARYFVRLLVILSQKSKDGSQNPCLWLLGWPGVGKDHEPFS